MPASASRSSGSGIIRVLALRWLRSAASVRAGALLVLAFAIYSALYVCVSAFALTGEQAADKQFGVYDRSTSTGVGLGDLRPGDTGKLRDVLAQQAMAHLVIESDAIRPDSLEKRFVQAPLTVLRFVEDPQLRDAFQDRYRLVSGTWPASVDEVAVSPELFESLPDKKSFTVLSGRVRLTVAGVVEDGYAKLDQIIIAGPGTWESFPAFPPGRASSPSGVSVRAFFDDKTSFADVDALVATSLPPLPKERGNHLDYLTASHTTRADFSRTASAAFASAGISVSHLPLVLLTIFVTLLAIRQMRAHNKATADKLALVGISSRHVIGAQCLVGAVVAGLSAGGGLVVGLAVATALKAWVLPRFSGQPLSPTQQLDAVSWLMIATSILLLAAAPLWSVNPASGRVIGSLARGFSSLQFGLLRRVAVVVGVIGATRLVTTADYQWASYLAVFAILLMVPDVLALSLLSLPRSRSRTFVVRRLMRVASTHQATAAILVACCFALPLLVGTQLASKKSSDASFTSGRVPPHQVWVRTDTGQGDFAGVAAVVEEGAGIGTPVPVRALRTTDPGLQAIFTETPTTGRFSINIMVVESIEKAERILGRLPTEASEILRQGGILDFTKTDGQQQIEVFSSTGRRTLITPPLPTARVSLRAEFRSSYGGAILRGAALQLGLPVSDPQEFIFPDVSDDGIARAAQAAVDAGYDNDFVQYATAPPPPTLPTASYVFLAALILGGFLIVSGAMRAQAQQLGDYVARLRAIGFSRKWTLSVLAIEAGVLLTVGLTTGAIAGLVAVAVTSGQYVVVSVPAVPIAAACLATIAAALVATASAVLTLRSTVAALS